MELRHAGEARRALEQERQLRRTTSNGLGPSHSQGQEQGRRQALSTSRGSMYGGAGGADSSPPAPSCPPPAFTPGSRPLLSSSQVSLSSSSVAGVARGPAPIMGGVGAGAYSHRNSANTPRRSLSSTTDGDPYSPGLITTKLNKSNSQPTMAVYVRRRGAPVGAVASAGAGAGVNDHGSMRESNREGRRGMTEGDITTPTGSRAEWQSDSDFSVLDRARDRERDRERGLAMVHTQHDSSSTGGRATPNFRSVIPGNTSSVGTPHHSNMGPSHGHSRAAAHFSSGHSHSSSSSGGAPLHRLGAMSDRRRRAQSRTGL